MSSSCASKSSSCPNKAEHTYPEAEQFGYVAWHFWAAKKSKTHRQKKCPGCGLYKIWVRK
jgi:hypothetical protein